MSRKSKHPKSKPKKAEQTLPFPEKVVQDFELSKKGLTDKFHGFNSDRMSDFVLREVLSPGGNVYRESMTPEKVSIRQEELERYAESAGKLGISIVSHIDFFAQRTKDEPVKLWTLADKVPGGDTIHDLFVSGDPRAFECQRRVMRASADYVIEAAKDDSRQVVATDLLKPSQFVIGEDGSLTMVDTNPPLWTRAKGIDSAASEIFMQAMAMNVLTEDVEAFDIGVETIVSLSNSGLADGAMNVLNTTSYSIQNYPPDHPQIQLMQQASLDLLLERPIQ